MSILRRLADNADPGSIVAKTRQRRFEVFRDFAASIERPVRLLDVGGRPHYWKMLGVAGTGEFDITILNLEPLDATDLPAGMRLVTGNACDLSAYETDEFDLTYSNSCIEHVGDRYDQARAASEMRRVGRAYFVQTPALSFPIEPHFLFPFFALLPEAARVWLVQHFKLGHGGRKSPNREEALARVRTARLLSKRFFVSLFPDGRLERERFFGLSKSWMMMGPVQR